MEERRRLDGAAVKTTDMQPEGKGFEFKSQSGRKEERRGGGWIAKTIDLHTEDQGF